MILPGKYVNNDLWLLGNRKIKKVQKISSLLAYYRLGHSKTAFYNYSKGARSTDLKVKKVTQESGII